jgi:hypothetical protein
MTMNKNHSRAVLLILSVALFFAMGCEGVLDVKNPNNVLEEDLSNPVAAAGVANGSLFTVSQGIGYVLAPYETVTDEVRWIGSRDAWGQLDQGKVSDFYNEFVDAAWPYITEGRWMADKAVSQLEGFDRAGSLVNRLDLARAYAYQALVRTAIADMFDDFVISDKTTINPPIGESNMSSLYDQAVAALDKGLAIAQSGTTASHQEWERRILGLRARVKHSKDIWTKVNPKGTVPTNPYIASAGALADAQAALAKMSGDYKWRLDFFSALTFNEFAWEVVGRSELAIEAIPNDPVSGTADARMTAESNDFRDRAKYQDRYSPLTVVSAREMHLIIAESFLAAGNNAQCLAQLNTLRTLTGQTGYPLTFDAATALKHERRANLFLQGRRLSDMYRFGVQDARWLPGSEARTTPGIFFPITIQERRANPNIR